MLSYRNSDLLKIRGIESIFSSANLEWGSQRLLLWRRRVRPMDEMDRNGESDAESDLFLGK